MSTHIGEFSGRPLNEHARLQVKIRKHERYFLCELYLLYLTKGGAAQHHFRKSHRLVDFNVSIFFYIAMHK